MTPEEAKAQPRTYRFCFIGWHNWEKWRDTGEVLEKFACPASHEWAIGQRKERLVATYSLQTRACVDCGKRQIWRVQR